MPDAVSRLLAQALPHATAQYDTSVCSKTALTVVPMVSKGWILHLPPNQLCRIFSRNEYRQLLGLLERGYQLYDASIGQMSS